MKRLESKVAVITGAARGIGRATAVAFAKEGATVIAIDKAAPVSSTTAYPTATKEDLEATKQQVTAAGAQCFTIMLDTRDKAALQKAAEQVQNHFGKIDILVANAGIQVFAPLPEMTDEQWQDVIDVNLPGTANTVRTFIPYMMEKKSGSIIITASGQGKKGFRHGASYAASKWGLLGFMKSDALDLGKYGIRVNALVPGLVIRYDDE